MHLQERQRVTTKSTPVMHTSSLQPEQMAEIVAAVIAKLSNRGLLLSPADSNLSEAHSVGTSQTKT